MIQLHPSWGKAVRRHSIRASLCLTLCLAIAAVAWTIAPAAAQQVSPVGLAGTPNFLPLVLGQPTDTLVPSPTLAPTATPVTPEPPPMLGQNVQCQTQGPVQICASVDDASPARYTTVTVYGRLYVDGFGVQGISMSANWHYKTTNPSCGGTTDSGGLSSCSRYISGATAGYQVNIDVSIEGYNTTTSFTPQ